MVLKHILYTLLCENFFRGPQKVSRRETETWRPFCHLRACLHGGGGPQVGEVTRLGGVTRQSIYFLILIRSRLHDRWGDPPRRVARSTRPGYPLSRGQFCHVNVSRWGNPPGGGRTRDTSNSSKIHFGGGFTSLLKLTVESHLTEGCSKSNKGV